MKSPPPCGPCLRENEYASHKQARDKQTQAVLPLRGKILNTWEVETALILKSNEIHNVAVASGVDPGIEDLSRLRYHKIIILSG